MPSTERRTPRNCGIGIRGVAVAIDSAVWFALLFVAVFPVAVLTGDVTTTGGSTSANLEGTPALAAFALWLGLGIAYHALMEWRYARTVGKHLVGVRVLEADGSRLTLRSSLIRNVARLVDVLPAFYAVGIVALALSDRYRRVGDRLAGTAVVRV
jgi:uncharacterized RDD family membrane protein YckC